MAGIKGKSGNGGNAQRPEDNEKARRGLFAGSSPKLTVEQVHEKLQPLIDQYNEAKLRGELFKITNAGFALELGLSLNAWADYIKKHPELLIYRSYVYDAHERRTLDPDGHNSVKMLQLEEGKNKEEVKPYGNLANLTTTQLEFLKILVKLTNEEPIKEMRDMDKLNYINAYSNE